MKWCFLVTIVIFAFNFTHSQSVGIGTLTPDQSSLLEVNSTSKGILIPRMDNQQRDKIHSPAIGLMIYNLEIEAFQYFSGIEWLTVQTNVSERTKIKDLDGDTGIYTDPLEVDDDEVSIEVGGFPLAKFRLNRLELKSPGNSIFIGNEAGSSNKGTLNVGVGENALTLNKLGNYNVAVGNDAGKSVLNGSNNVHMGYLAGSSFDNFNNTFIGTESGMKNSGSFNTFIGFNAGRDNQGKRNIFIGSEAGSVEMGSDQLFIDNSATSQPLIHGDFVKRKVTINNDLCITGKLDVDEIDVNNITGLLGSGQTAVFPDVIYNTAFVEIAGIISADLFIVNSIGWEVDTFSIISGNQTIPEPGFNMEFPLIFESDEPSVISAMGAWLSNPSSRTVTIYVPELSGTIAFTWQLYEFIPESFNEGSDGRIRYTLVHQNTPDNLLGVDCNGTFGNEQSFDPSKDRLVNINGITGEFFTPETSVDFDSKTVTLEYNYNEGLGVKAWLENIVSGIKDRRTMQIITTTDGTTAGATSIRDFFDVIGFKYEHVYGIGLDTKLKTRVQLTYSSTELR